MGIDVDRRTTVESVKNPSKVQSENHQIFTYIPWNLPVPEIQLMGKAASWDTYSPENCNLSECFGLCNPAKCNFNNNNSPTQYEWVLDEKYIQQQTSKLLNFQNKSVQLSKPYISTKLNKTQRKPKIKQRKTKHRKNYR